MTGDLLAQMLPSIITAGMTGAISAGGIALKGTQVVSKGVAKGVVKKQAVNQGVRSGVFLGREGGMLMVKQPPSRLSRSTASGGYVRQLGSTRSGAVGLRTYRRVGVGCRRPRCSRNIIACSSDNIRDESSVRAYVIRSGMFVKLDKNAVNSTVNNLVSKMGFQVVAKEGRSKFVRNGITELLKNVQGKGVGAGRNSVLTLYGRKQSM